MDNEFFEKKVRPILVANCVSCHGPKKQKGELRLDSKAGFAQGRRDRRRLVKPGDPDEEPARAGDPLRRRHQDAAEGQAGRRGHRDADRVGEGRRAVARRRAPPATKTGSKPSTCTPGPRRTGRSSRSSGPPFPKSANPQSEIRNPIDRFLLAKLNDSGLTFAPPADKRTLLRRVYFDLIGLPPTPEEIDAFLKDDSPDAYEKVVDRLLASPAVRRALGPALARPRPLRRDARPRVRLRHPRRVAVPRLRHPRLQRRRAVRPVPHRAHRRRPAAASRGATRRTARTSRCSRPAFWWLGRGEALAGRFAGRVRRPHRQPDRRVRQGGARADARRAPAATTTSSTRSPRRTTTRCSACSRVRGTTAPTSTTPPRP